MSSCRKCSAGCGKPTRFVCVSDDDTSALTHDIPMRSARPAALSACNAPPRCALSRRSSRATGRAPHPLVADVFCDTRCTQGRLHYAACVGDEQECALLLDAEAEDTAVPVRFGMEGWEPKRDCGPTPLPSADSAAD